MRMKPWIVLCLVAGAVLATTAADRGRGLAPPEPHLAFAAPHAAGAAIRAWHARHGGEAPYDADDRSRG